MSSSTLDNNFNLLVRCLCSENLDSQMLTPVPGEIMPLVALMSLDDVSTHDWALQMKLHMKCNNY